MAEHKLELFGLLGFLAFGVAVTCTLAYMGFLAYLAWKSNQTSTGTTTNLTAKKIAGAEKILAMLNTEN